MVYQIYLHLLKKIKDIAPNINSSQARYELYIKCCM